MSPQDKDIVSMQENTKHTSRPQYVLLLIFILLAVGIIAGGFLYYRNYKLQFRSEIEKQLSAITNLKVKEIVKWRQERFADAHTIYENTVFSQLVGRVLHNSADAESRQSLLVWLGTFVSAYPEYDRAFLVDAQGALQLSVPGEAFLDKPAIFLEAEQTLQTGQIRILDLYRDATGGQIHMMILIPIFDVQNNRRPLGVIVLRIDPEVYLYPFLQNWPTLSPTSETLIVRRDGDDVLFLNELKFRAGSALKLKISLENSSVPAVKAVSGQVGIVVGVDYNGIQVIADVRQVPDSPWFMVARMAAAELYAPLNVRLWSLLLLVVALLSAAGLSILVLWRQQRVVFYHSQLEIQRDKSWLQDIISRSLNEIYVFDSDTLRFTFANTGALHNIGYSLDELTRLKSFDIKSDYTEEIFRAAVQPLLTGDKDMLVFDTLYRRKDGSVYPVEVHLQHVDIGDHAVFLAIANDITKRKQTEQALRDSEKSVRGKLKVILEPEGDISTLDLSDIIDSETLQHIMDDFYRVMPVTSAIIDLSGKILIAVGWQDICTRFHRSSPESCNNCIESDTVLSSGVSEGEFKSYLCKNNMWDMASPIIVGGKHLGNVLMGQFFYDDELPDVEVFRNQARLYGFPEEEYLEALAKVPVLSHEKANAAMVFYSGLAGMISKLSYSTIKLSRSITEQKQAQEIIARQAKISQIFLTADDEEMYNQILKVILDLLDSPYGVFGYLDEAGALVVPTMTRDIWEKCQVHDEILRFPRESWGDSSWPRAIHEKKFNFSNEPSSNVPDGHVAIQRHITVPIMIGSTVVGLFQIANKQTDYTDDDIENLQNIAEHVAPILSARIRRDEHEKNLQDKNAELARFSYTLSHDLKSPLVTIRTFLGYLEKDFQKQDTDWIAKDFTFIRSASDKMSLLLDELLDLTRVGQVENPESNAPLQDIVQEALTLVAGRIAESGVIVEITPQPLVLCGDRMRLVEVFQNLIDNAVKFMGEQSQPRVDIGWQRKDDENLLFVRDNGMGIDPRYQDKVFDLFEKIDTGIEGTGLGLALVKRIVEVHKGRIWVESEGLGKGTCFWFVLPGGSKE